MRGLELPVNKALSSKISFWDFCYIIRQSWLRDLANKKLKTYKKIGPNSYKCKLGTFTAILANFCNTYVLSFLLARCLQLFVLWCTRSLKEKFLSEVPYSLVIPNPSFLMDLGCHRSNNGPIWVRNKEIWINFEYQVDQFKQVEFPAPKAEKTQKIIKSLVNPEMRSQGPPVGVMSSKTGWVIYREVD